MKVHLLKAQSYNTDGAGAEDIIWAGLGKIAYSKSDICQVKHLLCAYLSARLLDNIKSNKI